MLSLISDKFISLMIRRAPRRNVGGEEIVHSIRKRMGRVSRHLHQNCIIRYMRALKFITFSFLVLTFSLFYGCAGAPVIKAPEVKERIIEIDGVKYISLLEMIQNTDLGYEYDTFVRSITISNGHHILNFLIDRNIVSSDGKIVKLSNAPLVYEGELLIPLELRTNIIGPWMVKRGTVSLKRPAIINIRKVVIDPGHGGKDPGAIGRSGLKEKDVVLDIAKYLRDELKSCGVEAVMTRSSDVFIPLETRAEIANDSGADLFISIHVNAHRDRKVSGFEIYYLSNQIDDFQRARSSSNDDLPKTLQMQIDQRASSDLKTIIWDIIYSGNRKESALLAKGIDKKICPEAGFRSRGIKAARYQVLRNTKIPAILVELGFISNANEEKKLQIKSHRQRIAKSLAESIISHNSLTKR